MKGKKLIAAVCALTMLMGMPVHAAQNSRETLRLDSHANLRVGEILLVEDGRVTGNKVDNVSYDVNTNVLTLDQCNIRKGGIYLEYMGDMTIQLNGENTISGATDGIKAQYGNESLTLQGPGTLNMDLRSAMFGIVVGDEVELLIDNVDLNISNEQTDYGMFYGITRDTHSYSQVSEMTIKDSDISIDGTVSGEWEYANAGIDAQRGNLHIINSDVDISLKNGTIFGIGVGYKDGDIYGGDFSVDNSTVKCTTVTSAGQSYNHNMYFYNLINKDNLHFYAGEDGSATEKTFEQTFEKDKYIKGRYDTNYNTTVISSKSIPDYCKHQWDRGTETKAPGCTEKGEITYTCQKCGNIRKEEISALGHDWGEWNVIKEASCTEDGVKTRSCMRCKQAEDQKIEKLGHDFLIKIVKEPTCTEEGIQCKECTRCGYTVDNEKIPAQGHKYGEWKVVKEPTFNEDGEEQRICEKCGAVDSRVIPKLSESHEHDFSGREEVIKEPTCTEEGRKKVYCTEPECGAFQEEPIPAAGHVPGEWITVKEATCSENGIEERKCTVCDTVIEQRDIDKLPHTYGEWVVTKEPACTEAGIETAECTVCGEVTVRSISALGHDFREWTVTKEPTCTEAGEEVSACTRCGLETSRTVKAKGHHFSDWEIIKEPTVTEEGMKQRKCIVCAEIETQSIPELSNLQPGTPDGTDSNNTGKESGVPQTGDSAWMSLIFLGMAAAAGLIMLKNRRKFR